MSASLATILTVAVFLAGFVILSFIIGAIRQSGEADELSERARRDLLDEPCSDFTEPHRGAVPRDW